MLIGARTAAWSGGAKMPYKRRLAWIGSDKTQRINFGIPFTKRTEMYSRIGGIGRVYGSSGNGIVGSKIINTYTGLVGFFNDYVFGSSTIVFYIRIVNTSYEIKRFYVAAWVPTGIFDAIITPSYAMFDGNRIEITSSLGDNYENLRFNYGIFESMRIVENGVEKMNCYAVMDNNDVPCVYDEVSGSLIYNSGTGTFLYGELDGGV